LNLKKIKDIATHCWRSPKHQQCHVPVRTTLDVSKQWAGGDRILFYRIEFKDFFTHENEY
jgi:hypothetical protein